MGELRDLPASAGSWVRLYGSRQSYGHQGVEQRNTSIQAGSDYDVGFGWKIGGALSYTDSASTYDKGDADGKSYSMSVYGTWLSESGSFIDLVARYGRISNDFALDGLNGSYDNNAFSVSVEYGHRIALSSMAFVEPQFALSFARVEGDDFSAGQNVRVHQEDFDSFVGRVGVRSGLVFPNNKGAIQAKFSILNDFEGEFDADVTNGVARNALHDDIGGVWIEYGIGGTYRFGDATQAYLSLERSSGGDVDADWRWNFGLRHVW